MKNTPLKLNCSTSRFMRFIKIRLLKADILKCSPNHSWLPIETIIEDSAINLWSKHQHLFICHFKSAHSVRHKNQCPITTFHWAIRRSFGCCNTYANCRSPVDQQRHQQQQQCLTSKPSTTETAAVICSSELPVFFSQLTFVIL